MSLVFSVKINRSSKFTLNQMFAGAFKILSQKCGRGWPTLSRVFSFRQTSHSNRSNLAIRSFFPVRIKLRNSGHFCKNIVWLKVSQPQRNRFYSDRRLLRDAERC